MLVDVFEIVLAGQSRDQQSEDDVPGIGVLLLRAGLKLQRLVGKQLEIVSERDDVVAGLAGRRAEDVALDSRTVLQNLPDGDFPRDVGIGVIRPRARQRRVDVQCAGRRELPDRDLREELVDGAEVE